MELLEVTNALYKMKNSHDQIKRNVCAAKDKMVNLNLNIKKTIQTDASGEKDRKEAQRNRSLQTSEATLQCVQVGKQKVKHNDNFPF